MKNKISKLFIYSGLLLCLTALLLSLYNLYIDKIVGKESKASIQEIQKYIEENKVELLEGQIDDYIIDPNMELREKIINNKAYAGILTFVEQQKSFAILADYEENNLKYAPCIYNQSPYKKGFVIAGHATINHFGFLSKVNLNETIEFEDLDGNVFRYKVIQKDILNSDQVTEMLDEKYDFTIFTCTFDNQQRYTLRLEKTK